MKHCFAPLATAAAALAAGLAACDGPSQSLAPEAPLPSHTVSAAGYTVTDLGTLGGWYSYALNINDRGMAVGVSLTPTGQERAFVWVPGPGGTGTMQDLGTLGDWYHSGAYAINNHGDIAGYVLNAEATLALPVRWNRLPSGRYEIRALEHLGGHKGGGNAINNLGDVAGADCPPGLKSHIMIWSKNGGYRNLGDRGGVAAIAYDMNDAGQLAVNHFQILDHPEFSVAYLWSEQGSFRPLGSLGATGSQDQTAVWAINNHGEAVGSSVTPAGVYHAFIWSEGRGIEDLGTLGGQYSFGYDIGEGAEVVGESEMADGGWQAFIWSASRGMRGIGGLVEGGYSWAGTINGPGLIAGGSDTPDGEFHAVLWTPAANAGLTEAAMSTGRAPIATAVRPGGRGARPTIQEVRSRIAGRQ